MTAVLHRPTDAVVTWGGDAMPAGVTISRDAPADYTMTWARARALTDAIRRDLRSLAARLTEARTGRAHTALGYPSWHEYVIAEFGDVSEMRLPLPERRALHASMADAGLSRRDAHRLTGFSLGTVHNDLVATGRAIATADPEPEPDPYAGMTRAAEALARVTAQGGRGLTSLELDAETGWPMGTATAALSKLERRGLVCRSAVSRRNRAAYTAR